MVLDDTPIHFYRTADRYGCFSNFSNHPIQLDGYEWPTSEHYFQAQKFESEKDRHDIRVIESPKLAAQMGRDRARKLRPNWDQLKDDVMRTAVRAKFTQHPAIRKILLSTGTARIVEHTVNDSYWADGGDGTGQNMLGRILMEIREELR